MLPQLRQIQPKNQDALVSNRCVHTKLPDSNMVVAVQTVQYLPCWSNTKVRQTVETKHETMCEQTCTKSRNIGSIAHITVANVPTGVELWPAAGAARVTGRKQVPETHSRVGIPTHLPRTCRCLGEQACNGSVVKHLAWLRA